MGELVEGCGAAGEGERGASASAGVSSSSSVSMLSFKIPSLALFGVVGGSIGLVGGRLLLGWMLLMRKYERWMRKFGMVVVCLVQCFVEWEGGLCCSHFLIRF